MEFRRGLTNAPGNEWRDFTDFDRKETEFQKHFNKLNKLKKSQLENLYTVGKMSQHPVSGFEIDQSFHDLKAREISDSISPNEVQFQSMALNYPNTGGWNVHSSAEVSPDGRAYHTETVATTDGIEKIKGGKAEFQGFNEQRSSGSHQGDDKNFVKQTAESSKTHLQEKVVSGDENSNRTEVHTSSSTQSSSSKVVQSSSTVDYDGQYSPDGRYLVDTHRDQFHQDERNINRMMQKNLRQNQQTNISEDVAPFRKEQSPSGHYFRSDVHEHLQTQQNQNQYMTAEERQTLQRNEKIAKQNIETQQTHESHKRYVDMDKASPEYQQQVQYLMSQPGEIISNTVEYPKPNVKMITTVKRLPDGTIVRNKRYETEEPCTPTSTKQSVQSVSSSRKDQHVKDQRSKVNIAEDFIQPTQRRTSRDDYVDNVNTVNKYAQDIRSDELTNVETKFTTTQKSNQKYIAETTSKTTHEYDEEGVIPANNKVPDSSPRRTPYAASNEPYDQRKPKSNYTPESPQPYNNRTDTSRPYDLHKRIDEKPRTNISERYIPTDEDEIVIVTSEKKRNIKQQSNSQHITQTEIISDDVKQNGQYPQGGPRDGIPRNDGYSVVKEPFRQTPPTSDQAYPERRSPIQTGRTLESVRVPNREIPKTSEHIVESITSSTSHKTIQNKRTLNEEQVIVSENSQMGFPSQTKPESSMNYPKHEEPLNRGSTPDFSTQGFPSQLKPSNKYPDNSYTESPSKGTTPSFSTKGFPSQVRPATTRYPDDTHGEPTNRVKTPDFSTQGFPSQIKPAPSLRYPDDGFVEPKTGEKTPAFSTQGFPSQVKPTSSRHPDDEYEEPKTKERTPAFSTQGFPSQVKPTPSLRYPDDRYVEPKTKEKTPDFSTQGFPSQVKPTPSLRYSDDRYVEPKTREKTPDFSTQGFPSQVKPTPSLRYPYDRYEEPKNGEKTPDFSTRGFPSQVKPKTHPTYPDNAYLEPSNRRSTPESSTRELPSLTKPSLPTKYPERTYEGTQNHRITPDKEFSPQPISSPRTYEEPRKAKADFSTQGFPSQSKSPSDTKKLATTVVEITQKIIKKEREVDAAHRAFASSLRSSSPLEGRRDSYTDTQRHTPRTSISSNKTYKRDMRESSHDSSAPSEISRISTNTITKRTPSKPMQPKQSLPITNKGFTSNEATKIQSTKSRHNKNVISPQTTKAPRGGTTLRERPKTDNQNTKPVNSIISINDPLTTRFSKTTISENNATLLPNELIEEPCIKKTFYLLGPTDELTIKKTEEPSISSAPNSKDRTNSETKIPSDCDYQSKPYTQPIVESPQQFKNIERRTVLNGTNHKTTTDIVHDQRSQEFLDTIVSEDAQIHEDVDAFWRKPKKNVDVPNKDKETYVTKTQLKPKNQKEIPQEPRKPRRTSIGAKSGPKENIVKTKPNRESNPKESYHPNKNLRKIYDSAILAPTKISVERPELQNKQTTAPKITIISTRDEFETNCAIKSINEDVFLQENGYNEEEFESDSKILVKDKHPSNKQKQHDIYNQREPISKKVERERSPGKTSPRNVTSQTFTTNTPKSKPEKRQPEVKYEFNPSKSPTRENLTQKNKKNYVNKLPQTLKTMPFNEQEEQKESLEKHKITKNKMSSSEPKFYSESTFQTITNETGKTSLNYIDSEHIELYKTDDEVPKSNIKSAPNTEYLIQTTPERSIPEHPSVQDEHDDYEKVHSKPLVTRKDHTVNIEFIESERKKPEILDGASVSKAPETTTQTPTYRKKGVSSRETFEERCRQILGMEDYGSVHGTFKKQSKPNETEDQKFDGDNSQYQVKIEDCDDDNEITTTIINKQVDSRKVYSAPLEEFTISNEAIKPQNRDYNEERPTDEECDTQKPSCLSSDNKPIGQVHYPTEKDILLEDETFPEVDEISNKLTKFTDKVKTIESHKKHYDKIYEDSHNYNRTRQSIHGSESDNRPKQSPAVPKITKRAPDTRQSRKSNTLPTDTKLKSRSPQSKSPKLSERINKTGSSSETTPSRPTERRRSSTISVNTEIIIDHKGPETPSGVKKSPSPISGPIRKNTLTERKDSAPLPSVVRNMKDAKVSRSVSENIIKTKGKPIGKHATHSPSERHPKKCFATKTINLAVNDHILNTDETQNVIIDIQHAKSSREVSPDKIVPTPVPANFDVDKLRYPDLVQEPEDEPRKKPFEKTIPIFEEETNEFVGCHISEVHLEGSENMKETSYIVEQEKKPSRDMSDDECLLSVQEKVSKFIQSADETKKPKSSISFNRQYDKSTKVSEDDECLLSINEKVDKFQKSAEDIARSNVNRLDYDFESSKTATAYPNIATKLGPSAPQKSPELVRSISKRMSTSQIEIKSNEINSDTKFHQVQQFESENDDNEETIPHTANHTNLIEMRRQKEILSRPSVFTKPSARSSAPNQPVTNDYDSFSKVDTRYSSSYAEVDNVHVKTSPLNIDNKARRISGDVPTNLECHTFDNDFTIMSQDTHNIVENNAPFDRKITKSPEVRSPRPISLSSNTISPINTVTESSIVRTPNVKSINSDDQGKIITAKPKTSPKSSTKLVTARRNIFENNIANTDKPKKPETPTTGRRPSYMDHTRCSLEHIRRDSMEINKSNYSRKVPPEDEGQTDRITSVKFDIPQSTLKTATVIIDEDINIEEIYDIEVLEELLRTVTSYELRRRIRGQIRRIKKEIIPAETEVDTYSKKRPHQNYASNDSHYRKTETNRTVVLTKDVGNEKIINKNYRQSGINEYESKPSSLSPERGYRRGSNSPDINKQPKVSPKITSNNRSPKQTPIKYPENTYNRPSTNVRTIDAHDTFDNKRSQGEDFEEKNAFHRNSFDRKTFTKETQIEKKHSEVIPKRLSGPKPAYDVNPLSKRSPSPQGRPHSTKTTEYTSTKIPRDGRPEVHRETTEYKFSPESSSQQCVSSVSRDSSPEGKQYHTKKDRISSPTSKNLRPEYIKTSRDSSPEGKIYHTMKDRDLSPNSKSQIYLHTKNTGNTTLNNKSIRQRSGLNVEEKQKRITGSTINSSTPIWANRNNILRSSTTRKSTGVGTQPRETKSITNHKDVKKTTRIEQDSVVSSYGIGPTDENGLPLFGIKALKKKPMTSNVTEEITGCVIEEKYYSDNKTKPIVQRKETYYSTNPDQLKEISGQDRKHELPDPNTGLYLLSKTDEKNTQKFLKSSTTYLDEDTFSGRIKQENIINENAWRIDDNADCFDISTTEKSNRKFEAFYSDDEHESFESYRKTTENERSKAREAYSTSARSFTNLDSSQKVISGMGDVLTLMRNADHVVEEGDTADDQEARALLNKFIGASVIMKGAEAGLPADFRLRTNTNDDQQQEVKITRKTKTKSGSSASSVTRTTTCDLEDIWDEHILKQLLEQAKTYEERRKIRSRLRELMATREEKSTETRESPLVGIFDEDGSGSSIYEDTIDDTNNTEQILNDKETKTYNKIHINNSAECSQQVDEQSILENTVNSDKARSVPENTMSTVGKHVTIDNRNSVLTNSNSVENHMKLGVPAKEDSGTESGEDLRLIAAGLCDQLQITNDTSIIDEVTTALKRLEHSLREGKDLTIDTKKRKALLDLVLRLQAGLKSPEKLAEIAAAMSELENGQMAVNESSSPEMDAGRSNRHRFAKRRGRTGRHTIGVSREELADARQFILDNMPQSPQTPVSPNISQFLSPWSPIVTNPVYDQLTYEYDPETTQHKTDIIRDAHKPSHSNNNCKIQDTLSSEINVMSNPRPLSGDYSVQFASKQNKIDNIFQPLSVKMVSRLNGHDFGEESERFNNKKYLMKRANTIDIPKVKKRISEYDASFENEDKNHSMGLGLKRTLQVGIKPPATKVIPPFEAKTENDRKFLAFINKHNDKPGLAWSGTRSVSNWSNKFGSLKNNFEVGAQAIASKPPQMPGHMALKGQWNKSSTMQPQGTHYKNIPTDNRLKFVKQHQGTAANDNQFKYNEVPRRKPENLVIPQYNSAIHKPIAINQFKHAPSSVFKRVETIECDQKPIFKPIPVHSRYNAPHQKGDNISPSICINTKPDNSFVTSPPPSTNYVPILPWAPKQDNIKSEVFKPNKPNKGNVSYTENFNISNTSNNMKNIKEFKKRPSLPNTADLYYNSGNLMPSNGGHDLVNLTDLPAPINISVTYNGAASKPTFLSYPCLPSAVVSDNQLVGNHSREDSLTNPNAIPLVLTADNPLYSPADLHNTSYNSSLSTPSSLSVNSVCADDNTQSQILTEHHAVSKVMGKPQTQKAVTVEKRTNHVGDNDQFFDRNTQSAQNLLKAMKNINKTTQSESKQHLNFESNHLYGEKNSQMDDVDKLPERTNYTSETQEPRATFNLTNDSTPQRYPPNYSNITQMRKNAQDHSITMETQYNNASPIIIRTSPTETKSDSKYKKYLLNDESRVLDSSNQSKRSYENNHRQSETNSRLQDNMKKPAIQKKPFNNSMNVLKKNDTSEALVLKSNKMSSQTYLTSSSLDTPDIVKSSLPKDESQTVMKSYGPPQRHHYTPNAYQNPLTIAAYSQKKQNYKINKTPPSSQAPEDDYIPRNIVYNNVNTFTSLAKRQETTTHTSSHKVSDAWIQKNQFQVPHITKTPAKYLTGRTISPNELRRTKSGHNLAVPKMYEAGIDKAVVDEKQKTVAAYFTGHKSPTYQLNQYSHHHHHHQHQQQEQHQQQQLGTDTTTQLRKSNINQQMTANRKSMISSVSVQNTGPPILSRSATMPHIPNVHLLDESNVEEAFEQLIMGA